MWYFLQTSTNKKSTLIELEGSYEKIRNFFLSNGKDEMFEKYLGLTAIAQKGFTNKMLNELDYLEDIRMGNIPVFSERFKRIMEPYLTNIVDFYPCQINLNDNLYRFYAVRIKNIIPIIDYEKSGYRTLTDGSKIVSEPIIIKGNINPNILIIRDSKYKSTVVVSEVFKQIVESKKLKVNFHNTEETLW